MLLIVMLAALHAAAPTPAELYAPLPAQVAQATGRAFQHVPPLQEITQAAYTASVRADLSAAMRAAGATPALIEEMLPDDVIGPGTLLAVYSPQRRTVYLLEDAVAALRQQPALPPAMVAPLVQCVLAHELVHALQHEAGLVDPRLLRRADPMHQALLEGHAEWASAPLCTPAARGYLNLLHGGDRIWSQQQDPVVQRYTIAPLYFASTAETPADGWRVFSAPPAHLGTVVGSYAPLTAALVERCASVLQALRLQAPGGLEDLMAALYGVPAGASVSRSATPRLLGAVGAVGFEAADRLLAAHSIQRPLSSDTMVEVSALRFADAAAPGALLAAAQAQGGGLRRGVVSFVDPLDGTRLHWWAEDTLLVSIREAGTTVPRRRLRAAIRQAPDAD